MEKLSLYILVLHGKLLNCRYVDHVSETLHILRRKDARTQVQGIGGTTGYRQYESFQERIDNGESYG